MPKIEHALGAFKTISLHDMDRVALLSRTDTKFMVQKGQVADILDALKDEYRVLEIDDNRISTYESLYYDTADFYFYLMHHNGRARRAKVRKRSYIDADLSFIEVKKKDGKGNTHKFRKPINDFKPELSVTTKQFLQDTLPMENSLLVTLKNGFKRITLVNVSAKERVTIDLDLKFNAKEGKKAFDHLAIIEVKQERLNRNSPMIRVLKGLGTHPERISKYCLGMASLYEELKYNRFKQKFLRIHKLTL
ncbi:MAG: polyphosphate polymerase domain-containing protein [Flavobacteriaceae bacterium]